MLTIYSLNANGLRNIEKLKGVFSTCDIYKWDILCIQETFWDDEFIAQIQKLWNGKIYYNNYGVQNRKGVAILVKKDTTVKFKNALYGDKGRLLKVSFEHYDKIINVFSVYAPNEYSDRKVFFRNCKKLINTDEINIMGGDFNDYSDTFLDRSRTMSDNKPNNDSFAHFKEDNILVDIWRDRNPDKRVYSRKQHVNGVLKQSRIDAFIVSRNCMPYTTNCFYKLSSISDHSYVCIKFDFTDVERGPGMWIFNNTFLHDDYFCRRILELIQDYTTCPFYEREKLLWWDNLKYKLKSFSKWYSKKKHREEQQEFWEIHTKLQREYTKIDRGVDTNQEVVLQLESDLRDYENKKCKGAILRSKAHWALESDRNTSYFLRLEKYRQNFNSIKELYNADGNIVTDTMGILETEVTFYQELYSEEPVTHCHRDTILQCINKQVSNRDKETCDQNITLADLTDSLNHMTKNKSPGHDGLTVEFYLKFWNVLGPLFADVVIEIKKSNMLSPTMKRGIISLIYKKKGDKKLLKNWRPITLLNVDYKLISKTLASRLKLVLDSIISPEQTCSVPGRDIAENVASIRDVIDYVNEENISAYILKIDSEKAFDRVSHDYLFNLLPHFGFGEKFIEWIKILYSDISSAVKCNGHISKFFDVKRSVRQGCSLSALLYVIAAEPLNLIMKQSNLKGISIKGSDVTSLLYQHADDTTLTLADEESVTKTFELLDVYCKASGARVNVEKSEVLSINNKPESLEKLQLPLIIKHGTIEILGVTLGSDKTECENNNWKKKIENMSNVLHLWKQRNLSLRGKAVVINTLLLSKFWYIMNVQPVPGWVERDLKKYCLEFLWSNKPSQIKYTTIIGKEMEGGLNIPDIRQRCYAFRLKWLNKYFDDCVKSVWKSTMNYFMSQYSNLGLTYETLAITYDNASLSKLPNYYRELLEAWHIINNGEREKPEVLSDIYNQPLFSNPHITKNGRMLYFKVFIKSKITKIEHITSHTSVGFFKPDIVCQKINMIFPYYDEKKIQVLYNNLLDSIPQSWRNLILTHFTGTSISTPNIVVGDSKLVSAGCLTSKICYDILRENIYQQPTSLPLMESFGVTSNHTFWKTVFNKYKNPDLINLDFKISHNIIWTMEKLFRVKMVDTNLCVICETDIEDTLHLFIECDYLNSFHYFLKEVLTYFNRQTGFSENDFYKWMLFGVDGKTSHSNFINLFLSTARDAIFKRRCFKSLKDKLVDCQYFFEVNFKRNLSYIYHNYELNKKQIFENEFVKNVPFVTIKNGDIYIKWD